MVEVRMVVVHGYIRNEVDGMVSGLLGGAYEVADEYLEGGWQIHICYTPLPEGLEKSPTSALYEIVDIAYSEGRDVLYATRGLLETPEVYEDDGVRWVLVSNVHGYEEDGSGLYQE